MIEGFGTRLKQARKRKKLTQEKLARRIDTSTATVSRWESQGQVPTITSDLFEALVRELGVSPGWLLFGEDSHVEREPHPAWAALEATGYLEQVRGTIPDEMLRWESMAPWGRGGVTVEDLQRRLDEMARIYQRTGRTLGAELEESRRAREDRAKRGDTVEKLEP